MTRRTRSDRLREFVRVLRGFGLTDEEITALNGGPGVDGDVLDALHRSLPDDVSFADLSDRLRRTVVESRHGFELAPTHEPRSAFVALSLALDPYGCTFAVTDHDGRPLTAPATEDGIYRLSLVDSAGNERTTTFAYPEGPLDETNVPALVHAVEADLLVGVSKTFVLLSNVGDGWGFALLDDAQLGTLRRRYGDRIEVFGHELLAPAQPPTYADGTWREQVEGATREADSSSTEDTISLDLEVSETERPATASESAATTLRERLREFGPDDSVETIVDELTERDERERPDPLFVGDPVDSVFEDFSDVRLEPMDDSEGGADDERNRSDSIDEAVSVRNAPPPAKRVLVGGDDGGSGPAVVGVGAPGDRDVDEALETRFEQFSDGLPRFVPEADGTEAFRWHAGGPEGVSTSPTSSEALADGSSSTPDREATGSSESGFRFDHDLSETGNGENTATSQATPTAERGLSSSDRPAKEGTDDAGSEATDRRESTNRSETGRFGRFVAFLSRFVDR